MKNILKKNFIHRVALAVLFFMGACITASAQIELRTLYLKYKDGNTYLKAGNVAVYTFRTKSQAESAAKAISEGSSKRVEKFSGYIHSSVTDMSDGGCYVKMAKDGYIVLDPVKVQSKEDLEVEVISSQATNANGDVEYVLGSGRTNVAEKTERMHEVESKGKRKLSHAQDMVIPKACGNRLFFPPVKVLVDSAYAHEDARFIVAPVLYKDGKVDQAFAPTVLDGYPYQNSQYRRMYYNLDNDKLNPYVEGHYMENFKPDTVFTQAFSILNYDKNSKYKGIARISFENYNCVYHEDTYEWWDGRVQDPMRFLDWDEIKSGIPIDNTRYSYVGRVERTTDSIKGLHVNFAVGSAQIDFTDSASVASMDKLYAKISPYYSDSESFIDRIIIKGYASPEGREQSNRDLCRERAKTIGSWIREKFPDRTKLQNNFEYESNIIPWSDVADYLDRFGEQDDYAHEVALELRDIIAKTSTLDAQWARIRDMEWFNYVNQNILPHLRRVDISYTTVTNRVKSAQEIYDNYEASGSAYLETCKPYEFYELIGMLADMGKEEDLEKVALAAYNSEVVTEKTAVRHDRTNITKNGNGTISFTLQESDWLERNYPLAAYYVARAKLMRHDIDTVMLQQYIDWSNEGLENHKTWKNQDAGWWNDEAIVVMQILMYCEAGDFVNAFDMFQRHLKDDPKFERLKMFLRCMNCEWDNPEVRDYIAQTSPMNAAVVSMAQNTKEGYEEALRILNTDSDINNENGNVWYMRAICRFQLEADVRPDAMAYFGYNAYAGDVDEKEEVKDFGAPMLEAFRLDPSNVEYISGDGYFNDSYRLLVWYFYKRQKEGLSLDRIAQEYNKVRSWYYSGHNDNE